MSWLNTKSKWSSIIVTASTGIFAIISLLSAYASINSWFVQREASRPYFTFKESPIVERSNQVYFEFKFQNVGSHPATYLKSTTLIFAYTLNQTPIVIDEYTVVNDIPRDTASSLMIQIDPNDITPGSLQIDPYYIVINLKYTDPILNKNYNQTLYIKWGGVVNGESQPLVHAEISEKQAILEYIKNKGLLDR